MKQSNDTAAPAYRARSLRGRRLQAGRNTRLAPDDAFLLFVAAPVVAAPLSNLYGVQIAVFVAATAMAVRAFRSGAIGKPRAVEVAMAVFTGYAVLSYAWSDPLSTASLTAIVIEYGGMLVLFVMVRRVAAEERAWRWLGYAYLAGCLIAGMLVVRNWMSGMVGEVEGRYSMAGVNSNYTAYALATGIPVLLGLHEARPRRSAGVSAAFGIASAFIGFAIGLTACRSAMVAYLVTLALALARIARRRPVTAAALAASAASAVIAFRSELTAVLPARLVAAPADGGDISSGRFDLWDRAMELFGRSPLFGSGADSFLSISGTGVHAHSVFLGTLAELGAVGAALFLATIILLVRSIHASGRLRTGMLPGAALLVSWFIIAATGVWQYAPPAWFAFAWVSTSDGAGRRSDGRER